MSIQMVLLPVFVQVGLTFALLIAMALGRRRALVSGETKSRDIALGEPNWPKGATQIANCYRNQFELPVLFYALIALALPLRHADLFIVLMSWVFVVTRFRPCRNLRLLQQSRAPLHDLARRRARAARDVDLLRTEDALVDLTVSRRI
ncbi:hypothetical protein ACVWZ6_004926 [Bradyrhizobium sp. GM6.1]